MLVTNRMLYQTKPDSKHVLKEQLRLFAFDPSPLPPPDILLRVQAGLSKRERLAALLEGELNFHGEDSGYASHDLHSFAAKFPPQIPRAFIRGLTKPGNTVLDPMVGSGTSMVEALLEGRKGIGFDIDPLALRLCSVKATPLLNIDELQTIGTKVIARASSILSGRNDLDEVMSKRFNKGTKAFVDYWFYPQTQRQLLALVLAIQETEKGVCRRFLELTFSSAIVAKSGGVSRARDLAHSRPHLDKSKTPKNAIDVFSAKLRKNIRSIAQLRRNGTHAFSIAGDARLMPLADDSVDLVVTSPPYANAIDYMRAHKFSLVWFGEPIEHLSELRSKYIGSERIGHPQYSALSDSVEDIIRKLAIRDKSKAQILRKYFVEMRTVLSEIYRVLSGDGVAVIIVGTSVMRGLNVQTHQCLADIGTELGFDVVGIARRVLDRNKRMMPARFGSKTSSIEQRMHDEYVIGLLKYKPF